MIKSGSTLFTEEQVKQIYQDKMYVCNYSGIYKPHYDITKKCFYFTKVVSCKGYARRGRFYLQTAAQVNNVLGYKAI